MKAERNKEGSSSKESQKVLLAKMQEPKNLTNRMTIKTWSFKSEHSTGITHCWNFANRVRRPNAELHPSLSADIRSTCRAVSGKATMPFDSITEYKLDAYFYKTLLDKKDLLESDQKMADDPKASDIVRSLAEDQ
ncbi:hypothetical protein RJ639_039478 [Escallonia herrerae]|uniref:peroxidase n=1 Tax=Escallonia herrerae TaxID=1293975 RepID=A0AA88WM71_9ASTE|nr:hypothetical protein RJ639_039478 [Escallonia herrerae]